MSMQGQKNDQPRELAFANARHLARNLRVHISIAPVASLKRAIVEQGDEPSQGGLRGVRDPAPVRHRLEAPQLLAADGLASSTLVRQLLRRASCGARVLAQSKASLHASGLARNHIDEQCSSSDASFSSGSLLPIWAIQHQSASTK
jgi:hypothetical protein